MRVNLPSPYRHDAWAGPDAPLSRDPDASPLRPAQALQKCVLALAIRSLAWGGVPRANVEADYTWRATEEPFVLWPGVWLSVRTPLTPAQRQTVLQSLHDAIPGLEAWWSVAPYADERATRVQALSS